MRFRRRVPKGEDLRRTKSEIKFKHFKGRYDLSRAITPYFDGEKLHKVLLSQSSSENDSFDKDYKQPKKMSQQLSDHFDEDFDDEAMTEHL